MPFTEGYFYGKMSTNVPWREERLLVRSCILMGGPRREGNTAALLAPFLEECEALGVETKTVWLYDEDIAPCQGCMGCQDRLDGPGCVQEDGFAEIFQAMAASDVIVLATCGYPPEKGAGLWEEGVKRFCRHGGLEYLGMFCRQDRGGPEPFLDEDRELAVRDFARAMVLAVRADQMAESI